MYIITRNIYMYMYIYLDRDSPGTSNFLPKQHLQWMPWVSKVVSWGIQGHQLEPWMEGYCSYV